MNIFRRNRGPRAATIETPSPGAGASAAGGGFSAAGPGSLSSADRRAEGVGTRGEGEQVPTPDPRTIVLARRRGLGGMYVYSTCPAGHWFRWRHFEGHTTSGAGKWLAEHIECTEELHGGPTVFSSFAGAFESELLPRPVRAADVLADGRVELEGCRA